MAGLGGGHWKSFARWLFGQWNLQLLIKRTVIVYRSSKRKRGREGNFYWIAQVLYRLHGHRYPCSIRDNNYNTSSKCTWTIIARIIPSGNLVGYPCFVRSLVNSRAKTVCSPRRWYEIQQKRDVMRKHWSYWEAEWMKEWRKARSKREWIIDFWARGACEHYTLYNARLSFKLRHGRKVWQMRRGTMHRILLRSFNHCEEKLSFTNICRRWRYIIRIKSQRDLKKFESAFVVGYISKTFRKWKNFRMKLCCFQPRDKVDMGVRTSHRRPLLVLRIQHEIIQVN